MLRPLVLSPYDLPQTPIAKLVQKILPVSLLVLVGLYYLRFPAYYSGFRYFRFSSMKRILFLSLIIVGLIFISAFLYLKTFLTTAQLSFSQLTQIITTGWNSRSPERVNFLLLGLDQRSDEMESTLLTDTILFASLNPQSGKLLLVPLPRDLWIKNYRTKINSLYFYNKIDYIQTVLGQPVHHTLILNY